MFRANAWVVESSRDAVRFADLAEAVLKDERFGAMQNSDPASGKPCGMFAGGNAETAGFDPDHFNLFVGQEIMKKADSVTAPADARDEIVGESSNLL